MGRYERSRSARRGTPIHELRVWDAASNDLVGVLTDVNANGARVGSAPLRREQAVMTLRIELPADSRCGDSIEVKARCVWSSRCSSTGTYSLGFEFVEHTSTSELGIAELYLRRCA